jgi:hypothetical protein
MELKEVMEWLVTNKYVTIHKGKPKFTSLYHKEVTGIEKGLTVLGTVRENLPVAQQESFDVIKINAYKPVDWVRFYQELITFCEIPSKAYSDRGDAYSLNKYSEDGMKAFQKSMKEGYDPRILAMAIKLYYKSSIRLKKAVGNYMSSGEWKTDYQNLVENAKNGTLDALIKQEVKTKNDGSYQFG